MIGTVLAGPQILLRLALALARSEALLADLSIRSKEPKTVKTFFTAKDLVYILASLGFYDQSTHSLIHLTYPINTLRLVAPLHPHSPPNQTHPISSHDAILLLARPLHPPPPGPRCPVHPLFHRLNRQLLRLRPRVPNVLLSGWN